MYQVYNCIKEICNEYFTTNSPFVQKTIDGQMRSLAIPQENILYFNDTPQANKHTAPYFGDYVYVYIQPIQYTLLNIGQEEVLDDLGDPTGDLQNYTQYTAKFNLIFYTKSKKNNITNKTAPHFKDIFFNVFNGLVNIQEFLTKHRIAYLRGTKRVKDQSFLEGDTLTISRYDMEFSTQYSEVSNIIERPQSITSIKKAINIIT